MVISGQVVCTTNSSGAVGRVQIQSGGVVTVNAGGGLECQALRFEAGGRFVLMAGGRLTCALPAFQAASNGAMTLNGQVVCSGDAQGRFDRVEVQSGGAMTLGVGAALGCRELVLSDASTFTLSQGSTFECEQVEVLAGGTLLLDRAWSVLGMHVWTNGMVSHTAGQ